MLVHQSVPHPRALGRSMGVEVAWIVVPSLPGSGVLGPGSLPVVHLVRHPQWLQSFILVVDIATTRLNSCRGRCSGIFFTLSRTLEHLVHIDPKYFIKQFEIFHQQIHTTFKNKSFVTASLSNCSVPAAILSM